jgi:hypothetical protein
MDASKRLASADKYVLALYFNRFSSEVRRTLEGQWAIRDGASKGPLEICWPESLSRSHISEANALVAGYEQRALARLRKAVNDTGLSAMPANFVRDAGCSRRPPLLVATRAVHP